MSDLLSRREAARRMGVSTRAFDRHVRPDLTPVRIGRRVLFRKEQLDQWVDQQKDGPSDHEEKTSPYDSRTPVARSNAAQVTLTLSELRRLPFASTPRSLPAVRGRFVPDRTARPDEIRLGRSVRNG